MSGTRVIKKQNRDASCHQVFSLQGKAPKEIHAILTETLASFLPGLTNDLSGPMYLVVLFRVLKVFPTINL
jgi:hypothetical protein